jgi:hypothetical protein
MANAMRTGYIAECFWTGVRDEDLGELDRRIEAAAMAVAGDGTPVRYLGWLFVIDDEVVLVAFEGPIGRVRRVVDHADIPVSRILQIAYGPRPPNPRTDEEIPK